MYVLLDILDQIMGPRRAGCALESDHDVQNLLGRSGMSGAKKGSRLRRRAGKSRAGCMRYCLLAHFSLSLVRKLVCRMRIKEIGLYPGGSH